jgi:hypothetical protein
MHFLRRREGGYFAPFWLAGLADSGSSGGSFVGPARRRSLCGRFSLCVAVVRWMSLAIA